MPSGLAINNTRPKKIAIYNQPLAVIRTSPIDEVSSKRAVTARSKAVPIVMVYLNRSRA